VTDQVLHIDFVALTPDAGADGREEILSQAAVAQEIDGVLAVGAIEGDAGSDFDLGVYFVLEGFTHLEPFGTDSRYVRFLQGTLAPRLKAFAGADVSLEAPYEASLPYAACIALEASPRTYDWEVRERLSSWAQSIAGGERVIGVAVGERQRYRGLAMVFANAEITASSEQAGSIVRGKARRLA
jgi:hypothetical protein